MVPPLVAPTEAPTHDYTAPLRVWHWGNALLVGGQLLTILFLKVILNLKTAAPEFQKALSRDHVAVTVQQARSLAHIVSERIWAWHIYLGLALAAFWLLRVALELRGPAPMRFSARLLEVARRYRLAPAANKQGAGKVLFAKSTYALFYLSLTVMVLTGLVLTWADDVTFLSKIEHPAKEVHNVTMYFIIAFVAVHIIGVVGAELTGNHGVISRMVGGQTAATGGEEEG